MSLIWQVQEPLPMTETEEEQFIERMRFGLFDRIPEGMRQTFTERGVRIGHA